MIKHILPLLALLIVFTGLFQFCWLFNKQAQEPLPTETPTEASTDKPEEPIIEPKEPAEDEYFTFTYLTDSDSYSIRAKDKNNLPAEVVIPSTHDEKPVTSIGESAFEACTSLKSITIPESVTSIGEGAFWDCTSLESITIPDSVTSIGVSVFSGCTSLESITIPDSVTSIGSYAFYGCRSLTSVTIGNGVTSIGSHAFFDCRSLTSVTIPNSVTSIGYGAFGFCSSLTSITIPSSVTSIGDFAFVGCDSLTSMTVAEGNPVYHSAGNCIIETASKTLIAGCKNSVIPTDGSVTSIGGSAFYGCTGLTSVTIPDGVTSIGDFAFVGCDSLESITIPDSVTSIGEWAFSGCTSLTDIHYDGAKAQWTAISKGSDWNSYTGSYTIHCTDGDIAK